MGDIQGCSVVVTSRWFGFISFDSIALLATGYFCIPQKASVGMYSSCDISCLCTCTF